jgi:hypothetical protein
VFVLYEKYLYHAIRSYMVALAVKFIMQASCCSSIKH